MTRQVVAAVDPISTLVAEMAATEVEHARESREGAEATYRATHWRVLGSRPRPCWSGWPSRCC
jgi:hypothetical protein